MVLILNETQHSPESGSSAATLLAYDTSLTEAVIEATGERATPRLREVLPALIRHLHGFAREVNLTVDEWFAGIELINQCGRMSDDSRNETQLLCSVLGLETLVDAITSRENRAADAASNPIYAYSLPPTPSNILGPFYRFNAPLLPAASSIVAPQNRSAYIESTTFFSGRVLSTLGEPIAGATLDIWHAAPNGMYEQQDEHQPDMDLRGRFMTDPNGVFSLFCLRPVPYPIPDDGPVGSLLACLDRHPFRPGHIHVIVSAPGYRTLTTQLYDAQDPWLGDDTVFAVKPELVVEFMPLEGVPDAVWKVKFDFVLAKQAEEEA